MTDPKEHSMATVFVLSDHYLRLTQNEDPFRPSLTARLKGNKICRPREVKPLDLMNLFHQCPDKALAFGTLEEAKVAMRASLRPHNTEPSYIEGDMTYFAVPVIYEVMLAESDCSKPESVTAGMLASYMRPQTIPLYVHSSTMTLQWTGPSGESWETRRMEVGFKDALAKSGRDALNAIWVPKGQCDVKAAQYLTAKGDRMCQSELTWPGAQRRCTIL